MQRVLVSFLALTSFLCSEPSAFGAGDLSSDEPYGLTDSEKYIKKNNDSVKQLNREKNMINSSVEQLKSDIDGLRTVLNGLTHSEQKREKLLKKILVTQDDLEVSSLAYKEHFKTTDANITDISLKLATLIAVQKENYKKIKDSFHQYDETLKAIEKDYVSKKSFDALQMELNELRTLIAAKFKGQKPSLKKESKSTAELFKEGKVALKAKEYKTAATRFMALIDKNYKPATSNFYAGEAYFLQKNIKKQSVIIKRVITDIKRQVIVQGFFYIWQRVCIIQVTRKKL